MTQELNGRISPIHFKPLRPTVRVNIFETPGSII
jgi:hypothetical protein